MAAVKKGIAFTISALLLGLTFLSLAAVLSEQSSRSRQAAVRLLEYDAASDTFDSLQMQFRQVSGEMYGIDVAADLVNMNTTILEITARLPPEQYWYDDLGAWESFATNITSIINATNSSPFNISVNLSGFGNGTFFIGPENGNITYADEKLRIFPDAQQVQNLQAYDIQMTFEGPLPGAPDWNASGSPGGNINISFKSFNEGHTQGQLVTGNINATNIGRIDIKDPDQNLIGYVDFTAGKMEAWFNSSYSGNITLKTSASFTQPLFVDANATISLVSAQWNRTAIVRVA